MEEFAFLDATALADLVRRGEVTPAELLEDTIARIETLNPRLNAVITPMYEEARASLDGVPADGPFAGVPFLIKAAPLASTASSARDGTRSRADPTCGARGSSGTACARPGKPGPEASRSR